MIVTQLDGENTTLLKGCNQVHTFTNISDIYTKFGKLNISAKCNLGAIHFEMIS